MRRITVAMIVVLICSSMTACGPGELFGPTFTPTPTITYTPIVTLTPTATATPDQYLMGDCWHSFRVTAWQDLDGDGLWSVSEPPLEGVKFDIRGPIAEIDNPTLLSKADGRLDIEVYHPGECFVETYTIIAYPPDSYKPTTPITVTFSLNFDETIYEAQFGFRAVSK